MSNLQQRMTSLDKNNKPENMNNPLILIGAKMEADTVFQSPYYAPSYKFPHNPDSLCYGNNYSIYDEMINDDQIKAVLSIKKDMVINTGWQITCENKELKNWFTEKLNLVNSTGLDSSFNDILRDILSCYEYGFSMSEPVYNLEEGKYVLKQFMTRPPHTFQFELSEKGVVENVIQCTSHGDIKYNPNMLFHHIYQKEFSNPYGKSDLKAAYLAWKAKKFINRMYARYVERFATPTVIGKYDKNWSDTEINRFHNLLVKIQSSTVITVDKDADIEFKTADRDTGNIFITALDHYNMMIARSILIPDLMGISGGKTGGGSYALGKEQFKVFLATIEKDRQSMANKITLKIVQPLVNINFGKIPVKFEFIAFSEDDISKYLELWITAVTGKIFKANEAEINHLRNLTGFPEGEVVIPEAMPAALPSFKPMSNEIRHEYAQKWRRKLTTYEQKVDFNFIDDIFTKNEDKVMPKLKTAAKNIYNSLIEQYRDEILKTNRFNPDKINTIQPKFLKDMNYILKKYFTNFFNQSTSEAEQELFPNRPKKYGDYNDLLPDEFLEVLQAEAFKVVGDYSVEMTKKARNILTQGIKNGLPQSEIIKLIRDEAETSTERWLNTVVRTKTNEIYNESRKRFWEDDEYAKELVVAYQWSAILDERTAVVCERLDGEIFDIETLPKGIPPVHHNCRCILVPITKFESYKLSEIDTSTLKDMGGNLLMFKMDSNPPLSIVEEINDTNEKIIIAAAGKDKYVQIKSFIITNMDFNQPVIITLQDTKNPDIKYQTKLDKNGDKFKMDFADFWSLGNNIGLKLKISAPQKVVYNFMYIITDIKNKRSM